MFNKKYQTENFLSKNNFFKTNIKIDYAIIAAMPEELAFLANNFFNVLQTHRHGEFNFKICEYESQKILLSSSGFGTAFAASVITLINQVYRPEYFFIIGSAGGIHSDLKIGDVVVAETAFEAEIQSIFPSVKDTPFETCLTHPLKNKKIPTCYSADTDLLNLLNLNNFKHFNVYQGNIVTSNVFPAPTHLFEQLKTSNPYCIDMETSAFYQIGWLLSLKVIAIRGISNVLNNDGTDDHIPQSDLTGSAANAAFVLMDILNKSIALKKQSNFNNDSDILKLIDHYQLAPHPEGGYFTVNYKSTDLVQPLDNRYANETRNAGSSIYYLLNENNYSAWHRLKSDELWHFYHGSPLYIHTIDESGTLTTYLLGDPLKIPDASFQATIKAGLYFAAENIDKTSYSFVGCTVSPAFEYTDFELTEEKILVKKFPQHKEIIEKLSINNKTRDDNEILQKNTNTFSKSSLS